jgi:hypothetical protein
MIILQNFQINLYDENRLDYDSVRLVAEDKDRMLTVVWYMDSPYQRGPSIIRKTKKHTVVQWRLS